MEVSQSRFYVRHQISVLTQLIMLVLPILFSTEDKDVAPIDIIRKVEDFSKHSSNSHLS